MIDELSISTPWIAYGLGILILLAAAQIGRFIGRLWSQTNPKDISPHLLTLEGALLGLLGLMIGFTLSMAMTFHDQRQSGILQEANAIGTTALRADVLPEPKASEIKKLLHDYVQLRIELSDAPSGEATLEQAMRRSNALQSQIWLYAVAAAAAEPRSIPVGLFIKSVNEMFDLQGVRLAASRKHVPDVVFVLLYGVAAIAVGFSGYVCGLSGSKERISVTIIALLFAFVIGVIVDFDRPGTGFITVGQQPMLLLKESIGR